MNAWIRVKDVRVIRGLSQFMAAMRRNSASRHMVAIGELLMRYKAIDMYEVAARLGVSPGYAYQLMRMFAGNPMAHRHFARRGLKIVLDGGELRAEKISLDRWIDEEMIDVSSGG